MICTSRIAPTPSGYLHEGNAFNFLITEFIVRKQGGQLLLRIDDLDAARTDEPYIDDIFASLHWLGIHWDTGPRNSLEFHEHYSQQFRLNLYQGCLQELIHLQQVFACRCSRQTIQLGQPCTCRAKQLDPDTPDTALRIDTRSVPPITFTDEIQGTLSIHLHEVMPDFVVRRRDRVPAYQIASLVDDCHFGITTLIRGIDLIHATAAQRWLATLLGYESFTRTTTYHHKLIVGDDGKKLSKSAGATSMRHWREQYASADELIRKFSPYICGETINSHETLMESGELNIPQLK